MVEYIVVDLIDIIHLTVITFVCLWLIYSVLLEVWEFGAFCTQTHIVLRKCYESTITKLFRRLKS